MLAGYAVDLTNTIDWLCKFRIYVLMVSRTIALWLIALASIDRWLLSSANQQYRKMSSLKNAYSSMLIVIVFSMMLYAQLIYCYQANLTQTPLKCYGKTEICRMITDFSYAVITIVIPIIVMIIFGLLTISNVQNSYRRICITTIAQLSKSAFNLLLLLTYFSRGMPFYIYTLCGEKIFRQTINNIFKRIGKQHKWTTT
ncbi:unnamed protein product [Rotaria sp. Silwood1]|nr:unnamed protein product [Rotaria sp. Silwood1]